MNIGFDAKRAFVNSTGLGQYSRTLLSALATDFPQHHYYLYTPRVGALYTPPELSHVHTRMPQRWLHKKLSAIWRSRWVVDKLVHDGIELYHGLSHEIPDGLAARNIRSVVTMHDLIFERYSAQYPWMDRKVYRYKFRKACAEADVVIAISKQTRQDLVEMYGTPESKIKVVYQSCNPAFAQQLSDAQKESLRQKYKLPPKFMLYVGSIIERKNLLTICKAMALLKDKLNLPLVVLGKGGRYYEKVLRFIKTHGLQDKVIFLSVQVGQLTGRDIPFSDVPGIFQNAELMIYPSFFEGFGIPVLEGLFSQIPVITSNTSSLPEAGGPGAWYIDPANVQQLADTIIEVQQNATMRHKKIQLGWAYAQQFTTQQAAAAVMAVYTAMPGTSA
jgi:glycosyltransferase involved in cell wall biosynthesis